MVRAAQDPEPSRPRGRAGQENSTGTGDVRPRRAGQTGAMGWTGGTPPPGNGQGPSPSPPVVGVEGQME